MSYVQNYKERRLKQEWKHRPEVAQQESIGDPEDYPGRN